MLPYTQKMPARNAGYNRGHSTWVTLWYLRFTLFLFDNVFSVESSNLWANNETEREKDIEHSMST